MAVETFVFGDSPPSFHLFREISGLTNEERMVSQTNQNTNAPDSGNYAAPRRSFGEALDVGIRKFIDFNGRASRSEYWWIFFYLGITSRISDAAKSLWGDHVGEYAAVAVVAMVSLPLLAVGARRLHDINRSGWWQLLLIVPVTPFMFLPGNYLDHFVNNEIHHINERYIFATPLYLLYLAMALLMWVYWFTKKGKPEKNHFDENDVI